MFSKIAGTRQGQLFFDVQRARNSLLFALGWAAYLLLSMVDMSFRGETPSPRWSLTVGLPLALGDRLPLGSIISGMDQISQDLSLYLVLPVTLFMVSAILSHLSFWSWAVLADSVSRKRIVGLVAKEAVIKA